MPINAICRDVRLFLRGLAGDLPELFPAPRLRYRRLPARRAAPSAAETAARKAARGIIGGRVKYWAAAMGLDYKRIAIKDQRTLWGSCSGRKNLNFNWRLAAAPPEVLDYVVIHELCHLREMNHSKNFWALVEARCPDYAARRRWLRDNCAALRDPLAGSVN
ncbi:MAG: hypothetical protein A2X35_04005 [Elusimicrobia bacterium GWA2_61_42]|nr:MAG: hypothetical protein A2X35_04005 [Elusimicrobia bacterium GWA2_61_42]OGR74422.1 MAG: hypothetical protein A2X38_00780 [Elusimicrobia bacterium GWC2_61_25]